MKKILLILSLFTIVTIANCQTTTLSGNLVIQKVNPTLYLNGAGAKIDFYNGDLTLTQSSNLLTLAGGNLSLGSNSMLLTGSVGATANRILKGWYTDIETTNYPTVAGVSLASIFAPIASPVFTTRITTPIIRLGAVDVTATGTEINLLHNPGTSGNLMQSNGTSWASTDVLATAVTGIVRADSGVTYYSVPQINALLANLQGGGGTGSIGMYELSGSVGEAGMPAEGDSLIINTGLIARHIQFFREGGRQQQHTANTTADGFKFNSTTGTLTVRPVFSSGEQLIVDAFEPVVWHDLSPQGGSGGGGGGGESSLLTGLIAGWQFDETTGTALSDVLGVNNATAVGSIVLNQTGEFGKCIHKTVRSDYVIVPHSTSIQASGTAITISTWFKLDSLPSVTGKYMYLFCAYDGAHNYSFEAFIHPATNYITFAIRDNAYNEYDNETANGAVSAGVMYHLVCEASAGSAPKIYLNGADVTTYNNPATFSGSLMPFDGPLLLGNVYVGSSSGMMGYMDATFLLYRAVSSGERTTLGIKTHPWN